METVKFVASPLVIRDVKAHYGSLSRVHAHSEKRFNAKFSDLRTAFAGFDVVGMLLDEMRSTNLKKLSPTKVNQYVGFYRYLTDLSHTPSGSPFVPTVEDIAVYEAGMVALGNGIPSLVEETIRLGVSGSAFTDCVDSWIVAFPEINVADLVLVALNEIETQHVFTRLGDDAARARIVVLEWIEKYPRF